MFPRSVELGPHDIERSLEQLPAKRGLLAVHFAAPAQPYITQAADIRGRARKLLAAPTLSTKRLSLRQHAERITYACTGSQLEAWLLLYRAMPDARQRLKLRPPPLVRFAIENRYPRAYISTRLSAKTAQHTFGPFASRVSAESYLESVLDLFLLRRCQPDLAPDPAFPGCIYSEMHKCLAPCFAGCTDERYAEESADVEAFLATRGESMLSKLAAEREAASAALDFEGAAATHAKWERAKAVANAAPDIARAVGSLEMLVLEPSAEPDAVNLFLFRELQFFGPVEFSTLGMRHAAEQNTSSSLFAQPLQLAPTPLDGEPPVATPEQRLREAMATLESGATKQPASAVAQDHLALLRRWYFRPDGKKTGEGFLRTPGEDWPVRRILRAVSRVVLGRTQIEAAPQHASP